MMKERFLFFMFLLLMLSHVSWSQQSQETTSICLEQAQDKYDQGILADIPYSLEDCLGRKDWIKEEKIEARKLLTLTYIYLDDLKNASNAMIDLLKEDPEHKPAPGDPAEFIYLYNKFKSEPLVAISARAGANITFINLIRSYTSSNDLVYGDPYSSSVGITAGVSGEYRFYKTFEVGLGGYFSSKSFTYSLPFATTTELVPDANDGTVSANYSTLSYTEVLSFLDIPVWVKYTYKPKNKDRELLVKPYVFAGFELNYLISAQQNDKTRDAPQPSDSPPLDVLSRRENLNFSVFGGIGGKYKIARIHYIFIQAQYHVGLTNLTKTDERINHYTRPEAWSADVKWDDDVKLNNVLISAGFTYSIFRTKKLE
jgi:hypothetical protein